MANVAFNVSVNFTYYVNEDGVKTEEEAIDRAIEELSNISPNELEYQVETEVIN